MRALKGWKKASPSFRDDHSRQQSGALWPWECAGLVARWWGCAHPGHVRSVSPTRGDAVTQTFEVPGTDGGGVRSWVILLFPQTGTPRSNTGEADDTISLDSKRCLWMGPVFERLQRQPQDRHLLSVNYAECLFLFRRAAANLQVDMLPYQGRHSGASVNRTENLRTLESIQKRGRWRSAKSVRRYEKSGRVNQSWSELAPLVQAHCEHSNNLMPSVLLHGHASTPLSLQCKRRFAAVFFFF